MNAIGRVLSNCEHIIARDPFGKGLVGRLYVRSRKEYFDDIQDVKASRDMLDPAKHILIPRGADWSLVSAALV